MIRRPKYNACIGHVRAQWSGWRIGVFGGWIFLHESQSRICLRMFVSVIAMKPSHTSSPYLSYRRENNRRQGLPESSYDPARYVRTRTYCRLSVIWGHVMVKRVAIGHLTSPILDVAGPCIVEFNEMNEMRSFRYGLDVIIKPLWYRWADTIVRTRTKQTFQIIRQTRGSKLKKI